MESQVSAERMSLGKIAQVRTVKRNEYHRGPESTLYSAVCPLVYVFRVFGVAPYEFIDDSLSPSNMNAVYSLISCSLYSYLIYSVMVRFFSIGRETPLLDHTETVKTVLNYCVALMDISIALWSRKQISEVWNTFQDFDEKVRDMGYARSERNATIYVWSTLIFNLILWTLINRTGMYAFMESWIVNVCYMIIYIGTAVSVSKFSSIVLLLGERFCQLNEIAKKSLLIESRWTNVVPIIDAKTIERLHDRLMVTGETIASIYVWSLIIWHGNLCFHSISDIYFVINFIFTNEFHWAIISCLMAWITAFISQLILLNYACDYASSQAGAMGYIMLSGKRWLYTRDRNLIVETSLHMLNRKLNFSAGGCFNVNLSLLSSIAALMTTYLVILLQFE